MYEESAYFDPYTVDYYPLMAGSTTNSPTPFSTEFEQQLVFNPITHLIQQSPLNYNHLLSFDHSNWYSNAVLDHPPTPDLNLLPNNLNLYDPLYQINMFQSLPHGYGLPNVEDGVVGFSKEIASMAKDGKNDRHRRQQMNNKYNDLKELVPNSTKIDRASIVGEAIEYIKELKRTVTELRLLVEKKRYGSERNMIVKSEEYNGSAALRTSWLQRKSKDAEVDVRIMDDEVTIKLVQRNKLNCILLVSKVLDELRLDLHHVAGGNIGDHYSYFFNTKMCEGSSTYASAIANKVIEVVDICST